MNIAEAKQQVKDAIEAYLETDENGLYRIDPSKQRPIFLVGAPGLGKTAIMSQIAQELGVGLVSYSMTHHTRQSALGLPFIVHREFEGFEYDASEYTMSEIISSMYDYMRDTGLRRGILFLDEINCVSETLYPSMLQFLQFKTFGRHAIPGDWVVVCAGNPPEYNKSVHAFDVVTLDRLRKIPVEPDYAAWRSYAVDAGVHPAILSFLEVKQDCFYHMETTPEGRSFVTARGWEDLSQVILQFERVGKAVDKNLISQYVQHGEIAERFAVYYALFKKYQSDYQVGDILAGCAGDDVRERAGRAAFDERLALLALIADALTRECAGAIDLEASLTMARDALKLARADFESGAVESGALRGVISRMAADAGNRRLCESKHPVVVQREARALRILRELDASCALACPGTGQEALACMQAEYRKEVDQLRQEVEGVQASIANAYGFICGALDAQRDCLVLSTELTARRATSGFIGKYGSEAYYRHNQELQARDRNAELLGRIDALGL